ncbi:MAG: hypothetical protein HOV79_32175 [Hamadaea sp.]|nr:hypothetical protein [Hamadaea sp.]
MPLLTADDPLPRRPARVLVTGTSGSGKTRLAAEMARLWGLPRVELDALHHGPGWQPRPTFAAEVEEFAAQPRWVTEWQYTGQLGDVLTGRVDLVLWLDHPRALVMWQVVRRTLRRRLRRETLWNGNTEGPLRAIFTDPDHIIRWAWRTHRKAAARVADLLARRGDEVAVVRLRGRGQVARWVRRQRAETSLHTG